MSPDILRLLALVLVFGAVMLGVESLISLVRNNRKFGRTVNKRLAMIASGMDRDQIVTSLRRDKDADANLPEPIASIWRSMSRTLHGAGLSISPGLVLLLMTGGTVSIGLAITLFAYGAGYGLKPGIFLLIVVLAAAVGFGIPMIILSKMADSRRKAIAAQFPVALDVFVRGLRAGHPVAAALDLLTREMKDPIGSEFGLVVDEVTYGADLRGSLQSMADRWGLSDMKMFVVCLAVQNETGGNLAEILENLSGVIRERASMYLKVRALSSEGRMTAVILTLLPVLSFVGLFVGNPRFYLDVTDDSAFIPGFVSLIVLYFIGFFTIRRMINLEV